ICTSCGKIVEFENDDIERLQDEEAARNGFTIQTHKLELYGLCASCRH
ncbi:MAG: Fur family transcriptional regulator, partial [Nitrospiraceae bacterium]